MNPKFEKLKNLLKELFQLDQPDLDFGLYRIMHAKSGEVTKFLESDLLPQVQAAFSQYKTSDKAEIEKELATAIAQAEELGVDPQSTQKVKHLKERLKTDAVDIGTLESEVYENLFSFFRRYYSEGDFLAKRVYKQGVYAIPYEGEEVTLYWANKDQYYIKTDEYLRDYAFRLRPDDAKKPMRVHFRLVDAEEGEHGNVKAADGKDRVFILATSGNENSFISEQDGEQGKELVIQFEYRPATLTDWPEDVRAAKSKPPAQKDLTALAEKRVLAVRDSALAGWIAELAKLDPAEKEPDRTVLIKNLRRYTARNTFDYFIHKDLGKFLRNELDFYIKNEVMHLDDVQNETAPRVEQYLSKLKVIRKIAGKIIEFLAQLEDFEKKLWLKKKFVVETSWCIRVGCIPEEFLPEIAANEAQHKEWIKLLAIDEISGDLTTPAYTKKIKPEFLKGHPSLVVDTGHFEAEFTARLLDSIGNVEELADGILFHGDNFQALSLMQGRYAGTVNCVYIDPPYNAKSSEIIYKNGYRDSSWLCLIDSRLNLASTVLDPDAVFVAAIDEVEQEFLGLLLSQTFTDRAKTCITIVHNATGQQGNNFSATHEYAYFIYPAHGYRIGLEDRTDNPDVRPLRNVSTGSHLRTDAANCFYPIIVKDGKIFGFGDVSPDDFHPGSRNIVRKDGTIEVYPIGNSDEERKWVFARDTVEGIRGELAAKQDRTTGLWDIIRTKSRFNFKTVWTDSKYSANSWGSRILNEMLPGNPFTFPKSIFTEKDCIDAALGNSKTGLVLDYFAGSGTTGHAVTILNRGDGGKRKFILVEMGEYFDTVVLPRIKKVTFSPDWTNGKPKRLATLEEAERSPRLMKVVRLESYEDTLNNLELRRTETQQTLLEAADTQNADGFREEYLLRYMLNVEARGSQSLLNVQEFSDPTAYKLKVKRPGTDESREVNVDLLETFNWLIGLTVRHIAAPQTFSATFKRDREKRLELKSRLKQGDEGAWWFRTVSGTMPDGRKTLVIWRKLTGNPEEDNLVLDEWFKKQGYSSKDSEFDLIYVNGGNNLENLRIIDDKWKVRLIEEDFHRLMFDTEGI